MLGCIRLSRETDETTSPQRQREQLTRFAQLHGHELIEITEDLDTSGAVSPFKRDGLGPWLTEPALIARYDVIAVAKLDRLSRSLMDFANLLAWAQDHGKTIASVAESLDFGSAAGRLLASILALFAQFERERIGERVAEAHATLKKAGRFGGGKAPYGYVAAGGRLVPDPVAAPIMRRIVNEVISGRPLAAIARALNDDGIPTPKGAPEWRVTTVAKLVRSRALVGEMTNGGRPVRDAEGAVITATDTPLVTEGEWAAIQAALAILTRPHMVSHKADHLMLRVAYCGNCGSVVWHQHFNHGHDVYRCRARCSPGIRAALLEGLAESDLMLSEATSRIERRASSGGSADLEAAAAAAREIAELEADRYEHGLFAGETGLARYRKRMALLEARLAELQEAAERGPEPDRWVPTGQTLGDAWRASDGAQRHEMLLRLGITWTVQQIFRISDHAPMWRVAQDWHDPEAAHERLVRTGATSGSAPLVARS
jgi:site-specific DNA recombinase